MRLPKLDDDTIDVEQTKNTAWINCKTREDATAQFETSLKQTGAGYFDFYPMRRKTPCFSYGDIRRVHRIYASN